MDPNYIPPMRMTHPPTTTTTTTPADAAAYSHTLSSSPALYQSKPVPSLSAIRRHSELPSSGVGQAYPSSFRRVSNPYDSGASGDYSLASGPTIPSINGLTQSPMPSPALGLSGMHSYDSSMSRYVPDALIKTLPLPG